jgi:hypothetical protein
MRADRSHLPTHQFLSRNVRLSAFQPGKIESNYRTWRNGGTPSLRIYGMFLLLSTSRSPLSSFHARATSGISLHCLHVISTRLMTVASSGFAGRTEADR